MEMGRPSYIIVGIGLLLLSSFFALLSFIGANSGLTTGKTINAIFVVFFAFMAFQLFCSGLAALVPLKDSSSTIR